MATTDKARIEPPSGWTRRVGWLLALWCAGVAAMGLAAWLLRLLMSALGLHTS